jgi:hypothetical protein
MLEASPNSLHLESSGIPLQFSALECKANDGYLPARSRFSQHPFCQRYAVTLDIPNQIFLLSLFLGLSKRVRKGNQVQHALRVRVQSYPEGRVSVWVMLSVTYH